MMPGEGSSAVYSKNRFPAIRTDEDRVGGLK